MYFNTATVLLAISTLVAAVPVANQQNDASLEPRKVSYSVVAVDGSSETTTTSPLIETKTVDTTKYITIPASSTSPTATPLPFIPGGPWNRTQEANYTRKTRRTLNATFNGAIPVRRFAAPAEAVNSSSWSSLKSRSQNETSGVSSTPIYIRSTWTNGHVVNLTTNIDRRSWNGSDRVPVSVPRLARSKVGSDPVNWTVSALEARSSNATSLKARRFNTTGEHKIEARDWNTTYTPIPVQPQN